MKKAELTLKAIDDALLKDNGSCFKRKLQAVLPTLVDAYISEANPRGYLGASSIGESCVRKLWYKFRFAKKEQIDDARLIRLFNRGHLEEARFIALLQMINVKVHYQDADLKQYSFSKLGDHFRGRCDGVAENIPDCPNETVLLEFKTASEKNFADLQKKGVKVSQPKYYSQIQAYLGAIGLDKCLFCSVNKNNDELYFEIVDKDIEHYKYLLDKAENVIFNTILPPKINESPAWYICKWCEYNDICHLNAEMNKSCRLCNRCYTSLEKGEHFCTLYNKTIPEAFQIKGCDKWEKMGGDEL